MLNPRRRFVDIAAAAVFLMVMAVLFWPSGDSAGDDLVEPDETVEPTVTPTLEPWPSPTEIVEAEEVSECVPGESVQVLATFISEFNDGDIDLVRKMLPRAAMENPTSTVFPSMGQDVLHNFVLHESGSLLSRDRVAAYLRERHDSGEHWRLEELSVHRLERRSEQDGRELDQVDIVIHRTSDDLPPHQVHGQVVINCYRQQVLFFELFTDDPELALPIDVDDFLGAVGPYGIAEMRDLRMIVTTDLREDGGGLNQWDMRRIEANSVPGDYVENVRIRTLDGEHVLSYVFDGREWYLDQRDWREVGRLTGWGILPLEMMLTRREPSITANLLLQHRDEIPDEGLYRITDEFEPRDELLEAYSRVPGAEGVEATIEIEIEDGALVRTRYRLVSESAGLHFTAPEIRWIHIVRSSRYDADLFSRPAGFAPGKQQWQPPAEIGERVTEMERARHDERQGIGELYWLEWAGQPIELKVMPSRGGVDQDTYSGDWSPTWRQPETLSDRLHITVADTANGDVRPEHALWDDGVYRYELTADLDDPESGEWTIDDLEEIVEILSPSR